MERLKKMHKLITATLLILSLQAQSHAYDLDKEVCYDGYCKSCDTDAYQCIDEIHTDIVNGNWIEYQTPDQEYASIISSGDYNKEDYNQLLSNLELQDEE